MLVKSITLPIVYNIWKQMSEFVVLLNDVKFTKNLGDIKKGQKFKYVTIDFQNVVLYAYETSTDADPAHTISIEDYYNKI
jgi:hypothetical protein